MWQVSEKEKIQFIAQKLKKMPRIWAIAALVHESIGYHTPKHAEYLIGKFLEGYKNNFSDPMSKKDFCERCIALFNCNLIDMIYHDFVLFEKRDKELQEKVIALVKKVMTKDSETQEMVSLMYPTLSF